MVMNIDEEFSLRYSTECEEKAYSLSSGPLRAAADFIVDEDLREMWFEVGQRLEGTCTYFSWWKDTSIFLVFKGDEEKTLTRLREIETRPEEEMDL